MKRVRRIILNGSMVLSLILCITTLLLWVRSYWRDDRIFYVVPGRYYAAWSCRGAIKLATNVLGFPVTPGVTYYSSEPEWVIVSPESYPRLRDFGVRYQVADGLLRRGMGINFPYHSRVLYVSHWLIFLVTAVWPITWLPTWLRRRRKHNECMNCGYDLRASPGRCPECGTTVHVKATA